MSLSPSHRRFAVPTDWAWGGLGLSMATASASFAAYMIVTAPAEVTGFGSKDFGIFAHFDRRPATVLARSGATPPVGPEARTPPLLKPSAPPEAVAEAGPQIDRDPTGSIPSGEGASRIERSGRAPLTEFKLRDVVGDRALIEHRSRLSLVRPGSILAGAGEVLAIERQDGSWVVRTAAGVIGGS